jgi:hypothetical protein
MEDKVNISCCEVDLVNTKRNVKQIFQRKENVKTETEEESEIENRIDEWIVSHNYSKSDELIDDVKMQVENNLKGFPSKIAICSKNDNEVKYSYELTLEEARYIIYGKN